MSPNWETPGGNGAILHLEQRSRDDTDAMFLDRRRVDHAEATSKSLRLGALTLCHPNRASNRQPTSE